MAEFSKQYCELKPELGLRPDFDVLEVFKTLKEDYMSPMICEGFGFLGIGNVKGVCSVLLRERGWIEFDEFVENYLK